MNLSTRLFSALVFSLCFSQAAMAQFSIKWESGNQWLFHYGSSGVMSGASHSRGFEVLSGTGYIDLNATLSVTGKTTTTMETTKIWVEEGIGYGASVRVGVFGTRNADPSEKCFEVTFDSPDFTSSRSSSQTAYYDFNQGIYTCPTNVWIVAKEVDEFQLNASDGAFTDHVRVTWNEIEGATSYQVFRCTTRADTSCGATIGSSDNNGFNDTGGDLDTKYSYRVKACTQEVCGDFSPYNSGYRGVPPPPPSIEPPARVDASDGTFSDKIEVTWSAVEGARIHYVYISETLKSKKRFFETTTKNDGTPVVIPADNYLLRLSPGEIYYIWVQSSNYSVSSAWVYDTGYIAAHPDATVPEAPTLTSAEAGVGEAVLNFTANGDGGAPIFGYTASCGAFNQGGAASPITVGGLTNGRKYSCSVVATNAVGDSAPSNILSVTPMVFTPTKPTVIRATDGTFSDRVRVTFNTVEGATVYRVFRCPDIGNACGPPIGFPKIGSFDDTKGVPGTVYYYRVKACTAIICGKFSAANTGFSSAAPNQPTGVTATDGTYVKRVEVRWNAVIDATSYRIYRCTDSSLNCGSPVGFRPTTVFNDLKGTPEQVYHYRVKACTTSTCSDYSAADTGYGAKELDKPTVLRATDGTYQDRVQVTWNAVTDAVLYRVFRCLDTGQTCGSPIGFPKTTSFDDKKGTSGTVYYYRARACTTNNCGKFSAANTGYRGALAAVDGEQGIDSQVQQGDVPIPILNDAGRWFLILMTLGLGLLLINCRFGWQRE